MAQSVQEALAAGDELGCPVFAKIDASSGGEGVFRCRSDSDLRELEPLLAREPMLIQKEIAGQELDRSAIYADRALIHFAYSEIKRAYPHFGPSIVREFYPLPLVCSKVFDELVAPGQILDAGGFTNIICIDAADGSGRYYIEADMRPTIWVDFSRFFGEDAAVGIRNWLFARSRLTQEAARRGAQSVTMACFLPLSLWELLGNRYRVWRLIPFADSKVVWRLLMHKLFREVGKPLVPRKARESVKSLLRAVGVYSDL